MQSGGIAAAIQPADRFSSSSSAVALECSFDMAEVMLTLEADCGLGAALSSCFAACSMSESVASARTDLPLKGQIFHREAENRLSRRPREAKKLNFK